MDMTALTLLTSNPIQAEDTFESYFQRVSTLAAPGLRPHLLRRFIHGIGELGNRFAYSSTPDVIEEFLIDVAVVPHLQTYEPTLTAMSRVCFGPNRSPTDAFDGVPRGAKYTGPEWGSADSKRVSDEWSRLLRSM